MVRMAGLEPVRLSAPDPKSGASTNFATCARMKVRGIYMKLQGRARKIDDERVGKGFPWEER